MSELSHKFNKTIIAVSATAIIMTAVFLAIALWWWTPLPNENNQSPTCQQQLNTALETINRANQKTIYTTYHSQKYGFSIDYPKDWFVNKTKINETDVVMISNQQQNDEDFDAWIKYAGDYSDEFLGFFITAYSKDNANSWNNYREFRQNDEQKATEKAEYLLVDGRKINLYIERIVGFEHPQGKYASGPLPEAVAYIENDNYALALATASNGHSQQIDILEQALWTIKFD